MPVSLDARVKIPEAVVSRSIGEETVILNLHSGIYYGLDVVGSRIWELLATTGDMHSVIETMMAEYHASEEQLREDVLKLVGDLHARELVELSMTES